MSGVNTGVFAVPTMEMATLIKNKLGERFRKKFHIILLKTLFFPCFLSFSGSLSVNLGNLKDELFLLQTNN